MTGSSTDTVGIVVGGVDCGEADRVVRVLTHDGNLSLFAHGARKSRKRFGGALEPFTTVALDIHPRSRSGLKTLSAATVRRARLALSGDLETMALASYVVELGAKVAPENDPTRDVFDWVEATLDFLCAAPATIHARRAFELGLLSLLGYQPILGRCAECGVGIGAVAHFDFRRGGHLCPIHAEGAIQVGPRTAQWMTRVFEQIGRFEPSGGLTDQDAAIAARKLTVPTGEFFSGLVGQRLNALTLLDALHV